MRKIRGLALFAANVFLFSLSYLFYKVAGGDEYLVIFIIPLVCAVAPYVLKFRWIGALLAMNAVFLLFYVSIKVLNPADFLFIMAVLVSSAALSYLVRYLAGAFEKYNSESMELWQRKYNSILKDLEEVEWKGRSVEGDLARISRLYEIVKQIGAFLRFDEMLEALYDFLEETFKVEKVHFLIFSEGVFSKGITRKKEERGGDEKQAGVDYGTMVRYLKDRDFKAFFMERKDDGKAFEEIGCASDTFLAFPLSVNEVSVIIAMEGATKLGFNRFSIIAPQISLELRKVELYEKVEKLSIIDGLTGVFLRRHLEERLEEEADRARRLKLTFSVGMIDIDHFKKCNDEHGHLVGDAVLKEVAHRLRSSVREVDMIARYGGEEFCVVLPETSKELAFSVAERLRKSIESARIKAFDEMIRITVSAGVATFPEDGKNAAAVLEAADAALYKAKRGGRNIVVCGP